MAVNKLHPDYPEYIEKCRAMSEKFFAEEDAEKAKYPDWKGRDHPAGEKLMEISKKHNAALRELQKEYAYLFAEEPVAKSK